MHPLISPFCSLHCRKHHLVHLVSPFKVFYFYFWDGFLTFNGLELLTLQCAVAVFLCLLCPHPSLWHNPPPKNIYIYFLSFMVTVPFCSSWIGSLYLFLLLLSPSTGNGPYSCPETAALHHSQRKSALSPPHLSLCFFCQSLSLFGVLFFLFIVSHLLPFSPFHTRPCVKYNFLLLFLRLICSF